MYCIILRLCIVKMPLWATKLYGWQLRSGCGSSSGNSSCLTQTPTGTQSSSKILAPHTLARRAWDMKALVVRRRAVRYRWEQVSEGHTSMTCILWNPAFNILTHAEIEETNHPKSPSGFEWRLGGWAHQKASNQNPLSTKIILTTLCDRLPSKHETLKKQDF